MPGTNFEFEILIDHFSNLPILDVRSPSEYNHAHIPGAINLPLFSDDERAVVGTTYKQVGKQAAIKIGLDYFAPKMRPMVEFVEDLLKDKEDKSLIVHCWRGGMRSGAVCWLLNLYGFKVQKLEGGYKTYRNWVLDQFTKEYHFIVLGGYTGSGKTKILHRFLEEGKSIIDLEKIAIHKGSAFGHINLPPQPTQEMFENILANELYVNRNNEIWIEDESQRIGSVNLPQALWNTLRNAEIKFLEVSFELRLENIINEYGLLPKDKLKSAITRIQKRLGGLDAKNAILFLEENNIKECFTILLKYYDKYYYKGLRKRENWQDQIEVVTLPYILEPH